VTKNGGGGKRKGKKSGPTSSTGGPTEVGSAYNTERTNTLRSEKGKREKKKGRLLPSFLLKALEPVELCPHKGRKEGEEKKKGVSFPLGVWD